MSLTALGGYITKQVKATLIEGKKQLDNLLEDPEEERGFNWEPADYVSSCRFCDSKFGPHLWKHHCRSCGGVFCETCCIVMPDDKKPDKQTSIVETKKQPSGAIVRQSRFCDGCRHGEVPGDEIFKVAEEKLRGTRLKLTLKEKTQKKIVTNLSEIGEPIKQVTSFCFYSLLFRYIAHSVQVVTAIDEIVTVGIHGDYDHKVRNAFPPPSRQVPLSRGMFNLSCPMEFADIHFFEQKIHSNLISLFGILTLK